MKGRRIIGRLVEITDKDSIYYRHWGYVIDWDGEHYHISGGSISDHNLNLVPIFDRDQFICPRSFEPYKGAKSLWIEISKEKMKSKE